MNYELSQSDSNAEREEIAAAYEKQIQEAFSTMSDEHIKAFSEEMFARVPLRVKADLQQLLSTVDFDKLTKAEKLEILKQTAVSQYQTGAPWLADLFMITVILPLGILMILYGLSCGPSHNCDRNTRD